MTSTQPDSFIPGFERPHAEAARAIAEAFWHDGGAGVVIQDTDGRIIACNAFAAELFESQDPARIVGMPFGSLLTPRAADTHAQARSMLAESDEPVAVEGSVRGWWTRATYRRIELDEGPALLLTITPWCAGAPSPAGARTLRVPSDTKDPFERLTEREREILRLIATGFSTSEIAARLHRSVKTVEGHRVSLGTKLRVRNRVELARIAFQHGLIPPRPATQPTP